jgi:DnaK suppressor protein
VCSSSAGPGVRTCSSPSAPSSNEASAADVLAARREQLLREAGVAESRLSDIRSTRAGGSDDDEHDPEGETLSAQWSQAEGLRAGLADELAEVDRALARVVATTYGACVRCGRPIGTERLAARPTAELCIDCARAAESRQ